MQVTTHSISRSYARCARMQVRHDPVFAAATCLLPVSVRPAVHALYGFLRGADEIVDGPANGRTADDKRAELDAWQAALEEGMARGTSAHPVVAALVDAGRRHGLPLELLPTYLDSMRVDCDAPVRLGSRQELDRYMEGSAATVGRLMAPLLGVPPRHRETVAQLGVAFQLTNFLRDAGEDLALDRVYLAGIDTAALAAGRRAAAPRDVVARASRLLRNADEVCALATPRVRPGIRLASTAYRATLLRISHLGLSPA